MENFIEVPATVKALAQRRPIQGVGINDVSYSTRRKVDGKSLQCPYYVTWKSMINRCYAGTNKAYLDCIVCDEWLTFSVFREWMKSQNWQGMHLDKDALVEGNKVYSPETCVYIPSSLNLLLATGRSNTTGYPLGVTKAPSGRFLAKCRDGGSPKHVGLFDTPEEAHIAYCSFKGNLIKKAAQSYEHTNPKLYSALILRADNLI